MKEHQIPRPEHPRPQFFRPTWMNLNGEWQFEIDQGCSGRSRGMVEKECYAQRILVPFCPESRLSGVGNRDFMECVWYARTFWQPNEAEDKRTLLHFGAVDYTCEVWVNGRSVCRHEGGYASFSCEITEVVHRGENRIVVCAEDHIRGGRQPFGKQSDRYESYGCSYTRTTGIWQTVWLEWVPRAYIEKVQITPDAENGTVLLSMKLREAEGMRVCVMASYSDQTEGAGACRVHGGSAVLQLHLKNKHLWNVGEPKLYDLSFQLYDGERRWDTVSSYFGLRTLRFNGKRFQINGRTVFQRLVLDQGFYPDGIYTAPSDEALKRDIELSQAMGFNGARLHQKVFEQRFLYWADHLGYMCWGEMASWGMEAHRTASMGIFLREWMEVVERDYNSPCIVAWCPYNEVWGESNDGQREMTLRMTYRVTKAMDATRPCIDTSGGLHVETDIYDTHDYEQESTCFAQRYRPGAELYDRLGDRQHYDGKHPLFVSEYGGIRWSQDARGWGYGNAPETLDEYLERYQNLTNALLNNPEHCGFCYTQLTDVEQEQNGLYTYDRKPKLPQEKIREINSRKAAIEQGGEKDALS